MLMQFKKLLLFRPTDGVDSLHLTPGISVLFRTVRHKRLVVLKLRYISEAWLQFMNCRKIAFENWSALFLYLTNQMKVNKNLLLKKIYLVSRKGATSNVII